MSQKKHKGDHATRAERRAAERREAVSLLSPEKPRRVYLRNSLYIFLTALCVVGVLAVVIGFQFLGWWDSLIGSVLVVAVGAFGCMCVYDLGLLISSCVAFGEGMVNAGKNAEGVRMVFHASSVIRMEIRDKEGTPLPTDRAVYKNVDLAFVMASGRVNLKRLSRLTQKQWAALTEALEAERHTDAPN